MPQFLQDQVQKYVHQLGPRPRVIAHLLITTETQFCFKGVVEDNFITCVSDASTPLGPEAPGDEMKT